MRIKQQTRYLLVAIAVMTCVHPCFCQEQHLCHQSIAAAVALNDGQILRGLKATNFRVEMDRQPAKTVESHLDTSPKRILLLLDLGKQVNEAAWKIATDAAIFIATNARPEDRFALLTFDGPKQVIEFSQPRQDILAKLAALSLARPAPASRNDALYDGLLDAARAFGTPQFGDSVLLFSHWRDEGSSATLKDVEDDYESHQLRLFVFTFGQGPKGMYFSSFRQGPDGKPISDVSTIVPIRTDLDVLAERTGGVLVAEDTESELHTYHLTDSRLGALETLAWHLYGQMAEPYSIDLARSTAEKPAPLKIQITEDVLKRFPAHVLYSRELPACESARP